MNRGELILAGFVALLIIGGISLNTYQINSCRMEALKAGRNAEEISKVCR